MKIENKLSEITRLIENIKKHSDNLNGLGTILVLEIAVILSKINKLQEEAVVLKYLCEMQQGKRVDLHPIELTATAVSNEEDQKESKEKKNQLKSEKNKGVEEDAMLSEKGDSTNEALDRMVEATINIEEEKEKPSTDKEASTLSSENKKDELEGTQESELENISDLDTELNDGLFNKILDEAINNEKEAEQAESLAEQLEDNNEISSKPDINEAFASEDSSISGHLQKQPIADLMSAIGLNERYLYANDLFEGDMQEFKNAIKMLNEFENVGDAKSFFESGLRGTYGWDDENELAKALFNLIERRYL
ncbi:hypothetical protein N9515_02610 [Vicingaceae bacterium]|nr:hypothetical protein [Vicingaceae bacterium]MDB4060834.1 hypothetical protein [Vicingaceae bacterium]